MLPTHTPRTTLYERLGISGVNTHTVRVIEPRHAIRVIAHCQHSLRWHPLRLHYKTSSPLVSPHPTPLPNPPHTRCRFSPPYPLRLPIHQNSDYQFLIQFLTVYFLQVRRCLLMAGLNMTYHYLSQNRELLTVRIKCRGLQEIVLRILRVTRMIWFNTSPNSTLQRACTTEIYLVGFSV